MLKKTLKLLKAVNLFSNGSKTIDDIAFAPGFYDLSSFTVQFKKNHEHETTEAPQNYFSERGLDWPLAGEPLKSLIE